MILLIFLLGSTSVCVAALTPYECKLYEWACADGTCIDAVAKCNGEVDCPDGSDETFPLCRNTECSGFQCTYGGCVDNSATCNGVRDCVDNSDELLLKCRNESTYLSECVQKSTTTEKDYVRKYEQCVKNLRRTCKNGQELRTFQKCDGKIDCADGSDETLETCATDQHNCKARPFGSKFRCRYGACVHQSAVCNGVKDCADGSDELQGLCDGNHDGEWECDDGTRINATMKCNGVIDCPDGSDETFLTCRNNDCPLGFRCAYGGCVRNNVTCDGVRDCIDNSDELLTKCRNQETFKECHDKLRQRDLMVISQIYKSNRCEFIDGSCKNGQRLKSYRNKCDGKVHCADGSDESLETCATDRYNCLANGNFMCKYGACVSQSKVCDKVNDCADGSDELEKICDGGKCLLPDFPANGHYTVLKNPRAYPGQGLKTAELVYSCNPGYKLNALTATVSCTDGSWADEQLKCIPQCHLKKDPSIIYWCSKGSVSKDVTECGELVADGSTVQPQCRDSNGQNARKLTAIHCVRGRLDRPLPTCSPDCGLVSLGAGALIINGTAANKGELPWHAAIYRKPIDTSTSDTYELICGGSLISYSVIISAAHCFWLEKLLPAEHYAVALGKNHRSWDDPRDAVAQKFDVKKITIAQFFHGSETNFQDDIALVTLASPAEYQLHVRPVCLDFDPDFESKQLYIGATGKVGGWGYSSEDGAESPMLKITKLRYVDVDRCYQDSPQSFYLYITSDKICASSNNSAVCQGDSGGGLVFASNKSDTIRYYLRGVVSTKPKDDRKCNVFAHTTFTRVSKHQAFIEQHWNEVSVLPPVTDSFVDAVRTENSTGNERTAVQTDPEEDSLDYLHRQNNSVDAVRTENSTGNERTADQTDPEEDSQDCLHQQNNTALRNSSQMAEFYSTFLTLIVIFWTIHTISL